MTPKKAGKSSKKSLATWPSVWTHPPSSRKCAEPLSWTIKPWKKWFTFISPLTPKTTPIFQSWPSTPLKKTVNTQPPRFKASLWETSALSGFLITSTASCPFWDNFFWISTPTWRKLRLQDSWKYFITSLLPFWVTFWRIQTTPAFWTRFGSQSNNQIRLSQQMPFWHSIKSWYPKAESPWIKNCSFTSCIDCNNTIRVSNQASLTFCTGTHLRTKKSSMKSWPFCGRIWKDHRPLWYWGQSE